LRRAKFLFFQSALPVRDDDEIVTCFRDGQVTLRKNRRKEGFTNAIKELGYQGIRKGQLVLHSMDAFAGAIGVSDSDGKCSPEYIICDPREAEVVNHYYGYLLRVMALNGFIQASCPAVRERAPRIRFSDLGEMFLPLPTKREQRAIVAHIAAETTKLDAMRLATERTIDLIQERRAALIAAAVTGQLKVA
jgi:type I restriction enzyme S subunit